MDKISLNALQLQINDAIKTFDFNGQTIKVKQYLPVNEKLEIVSWVINQSADDLKFYNVGKIAIFRDIAIIKYYTNINIDENDLNNTPLLYDLITSTKLINHVLGNIPQEEYDWICDTLEDTVESIYKYQNSAMGILDTLTTDYKDLNFDVEQLQKNISNPENLALLKDVVTKLG